MLYVYTIGIEQDGKSYAANVILSSRVVRSAAGEKLLVERFAARAIDLYRRKKGLPQPGFREPHSVKQQVVNQFNSAYMDSQEYHDFKQLEAERKAEVFKRRRGVVIPDGFRKVELREFGKLTIKRGRIANLREHIWYLVLGLANVPDALTPKANWS